MMTPAFCFLAARLIAPLLMDLPHTQSPRTGWLHAAGVRVRQWWLVKMIGTTLVMTAFFLAYFWVLHHPLFPVTTMPLTALDRMIPFQSAMLPLYLSLWLYVSLAPALLCERREMISYPVATIGLSLVGLVIFLFWPTNVRWPDVDWSQHPTFAFLQSVDAAGNVCPSMHVAFAVFTAIWLERILRQMGAGIFVCAFNWLWCLGILYSTVATRQHVVVDVLAGAVLGAVVAAVHLHWLCVKRI
jgi:hypothetical protein